MSEKKISRRELLRTAARGAAAASVFTIVPRHVLGGVGYKAPSDQITRAIIGTGGMGKGHIPMVGGLLVAICDVDRTRLREGQERAKEHGTNPKLYRDFREVLARPDIDVVHVVTPPHWHAIMAIWAAQAGKDVYCEKPMTRTIAEGLEVIKAVQNNGRIFRVNTGSRFGGEWYGSGMDARNIKRLVQSGVFGSPVKMTLGKSTGFDWKLDQWSGSVGQVEEPVPAELDYDMWLGPAPWKPYHHDRVHMRFRGYWDYDGGGLGDMGQHYLDPTQFILGKDSETPVSVEVEAPQQHPDAVGYFTTITLRYADGTQIVIDGTEERPDVPLIDGPDNKLYKGYKSDKGDLAPMLATLPQLPPDPSNSDFYNYVRSREKFPLNEEVAHRSATLINLAKTALRLGRKLEFDPATMRFVKDDEANAFMDQPMRGPWHL